MYEDGDQWQIMANKYINPWDNARSSRNRFSWGVHAEQFTAPIGYNWTKDNMDDAQEQIIVDPTPDEEADAANEVIDILEETGYTVASPPKEGDPQEKPITRVTSNITKPAEGQEDPQYNEQVLQDMGFDEEMSQEIQSAQREKTVKNPVPYHLKQIEDKDNFEAELVVDEHDMPQLPATVTPRVNKDGKKDYDLHNMKFYRRSELWKALGLAKAPSWERRGGGGKYVPWPKSADEKGN